MDEGTRDRSGGGSDANANFLKFIYSSGNISSGKRRRYLRSLPARKIFLIVNRAI